MSDQASESLLLRLVEELGGCRDVACIYRKAARIFGDAFAPFDVYGVIASDPEEMLWRAIPLENPNIPSWGGLAVHQLEKESDTDALALRHGNDISMALHGSEVFRNALLTGLGPLEVQRATSPVLAAHLTESLNIPVASALGAGWSRPRGGRGWMFIVCREDRAFDEMTKSLFFAAVRVTARMAWYPGLVQGMRQQENLNRQLRRNIVHDLKNPLTVIKGSTQTLLDSWNEMDDSTKKEFLAGVLEHSERLLLDLQDVLAPLDKVWAPQLEDFDLAHLLCKIRMAETYTERSQNHDIVVEGCDAPMVIKGDPRKIRRVFENLLSNAVKYSPPEHGERKKIWIQLSRNEDEVLVAVKDEGIGMDDVQLARVMNKGGRVADSKLGIEGNGFGIDSCRRILEAHQGQLLGDSVKGGGSTFTAVLPVKGPKGSAI